MVNYPASVCVEHNWPGDFGGCPYCQNDTEFSLSEAIRREEAAGAATEVKVMAANARQVGGAHYKTTSGVQHWDLVVQLNMDYFIGNASKYLARGHLKNGRQDYAKAVHYIDKRDQLGWDNYVMNAERAGDAWAFCLEQGMPGMASKAMLALLSGRPAEARVAAQWLAENWLPDE